MNETGNFSAAHAAGRSPMHGSRMEVAQPRVTPECHSEHWSIYLVFASVCLLVVGLASDPKVAEMVRSLLALR